MAVKLIDSERFPPNYGVNDVKNEVMIFRSLDHPHIVKFLGMKQI